MGVREGLLLLAQMRVCDTEPLVHKSAESELAVGELVME